jgi:hypothetical protein
MYKCFYLNWDLICDLLDDGTLKGCVPLMPKVHSFVLCLNLLKFSLYYVLNENSNMMISKLRSVCSIQSCDSPRDLKVIWGMSNIVISKLLGVCRTQSCDPPPGLEISWGLKMSKLLNLIAYSLAIFLTCTNLVLSCICERLAKLTSWIFVALFEMMPNEFIYACFGGHRSPYAYPGLS